MHVVLGYMYVVRPCSLPEGEGKGRMFNVSFTFVYNMLMRGLRCQHIHVHIYTISTLQIVARDSTPIAGNLNG